MLTTFKMKNIYKHYLFKKIQNQLLIANTLWNYIGKSNAMLSIKKFSISFSIAFKGPQPPT